MSDHFPPGIRNGLVALRRRIRRIRLFRGVLRTLGVMFAGLLVIVVLDFALAPLPFLVRAVLFFTWLASMAVTVVVCVVIPVMKSLPLVRLARWLEERHPDLQERISTTLELAGHSEGVSPTLLEELSEAAASDMDSLDPKAEVRVRRIRASVWPAAAGLLAIVLLLLVWPREMGRLLTRAVLPFSELGNAGAFRFTIKPGDIEVLEGDPLELEFTYNGELEGDLELIIDREEGRVLEQLKPVSSGGGEHRYSYAVHSTEAGFRYSARVARNESDRFEVKVYPIPRLLEPMVKLDFPSYTGWPDRKMPLGAGIRALAGTRVEVSGRLDTPVTSGELVFHSEKIGDLELAGNARGSEVRWSDTLKSGQDGVAFMTVEHRLGRQFDAVKFGLAAVEDAVPEVRILTPLERSLRVQPGDQAIITYLVVEEIGVARAEIELEVDDGAVAPLSEVLPERTNPGESDEWKGEAMVYLRSLVAKYPKAREFRMRLKISDNRPAELGGPGVGYSDWVKFKLDRNAESLARQKLKNQDADLKKTVEEVVKKVGEARDKMRQARNLLREEKVTRNAEETLSKAREDLKEAQTDLADLSERMKEGVQEHRRDEVARASEKLAEAQEAIENAPLQDTSGARQDEVDRALQESEEAIRDLQKLRQEVEKDRPKIDALAKLQELAQQQEELARQAAGATPGEEWQKKQERMRDEIRNQVRQSPEAKAAAIRAQAENALELAREARALEESQKKLSDVSKQVGEVPAAMNGEAIRKALVEEQQKALAEARQEMAEARREGEKERGKELGQAVLDSEKAARKGNESKLSEAAKAARKASENLARSSEEAPTQKSLAEKQEKLAEAFEALAGGQTSEAQAALEDLQNSPTLRELGESLAGEQKKTVDETREELTEARRNQEARAGDLAEALEEAEAALSGAQKNEPKKAAEAAARASGQLSESEGSPASQKLLKKKQEKLAEAFEALARGDGAQARAALEEAQNVPRPDDVTKALAQAQEDFARGLREESGKAGEEKAEALAFAAEKAGEAAEKARSNEPGEASDAAREAAGQLAKGAEKGSPQESSRKQQESLADAFAALAEGDVEEAFGALEEMQAERLSNALEQALVKEQEAVVDGARAELGEAREALEERANHLPEALAQAQAALEQAKLGDVEAAAAAAEVAAGELAKGSESSASQKSLQGRQEEIAGALESLAEGNPAQALAALQEMQSRRAGALADEIRGMAPVEGNPLSEAGQLANGGAQKAAAASQSQKEGQSGKASEQHDAAAEQFARAGQSLESASRLMERQAKQAAEESGNPNRAPAPGKPMAEALQKSSQAAQAGKSGQSQTASEGAQAAAKALQQAARQASANMKQGGQPGEQMARGEEPGEGESDSPPSDEAKEGVRQAQAGKGVPPELAKLGINVADWEKIQATLKTDVGGTGGGTIPEDYRGLVQQYFEQISKKK